MATPSTETETRKPCAALLAGGRSSRMGSNKALRQRDGEPLVRTISHLLQEVFPRRIVLTSVPEVALAAELPAVPDVYENRGPLGGLHAALLHLRAPVFLVACDMPNLNPQLMAHMVELFVANPCPVLAPHHQGFWEPVHAIYSPDLLPEIEEILREQTHPPSFQKLLARWGAVPVPEPTLRRFSPDLALFRNENLPEDRGASCPPGGPTTL